MKTCAAILPPLDPNVAPYVADADEARRIETLRRLIATGELSPSRRRLAQNELRVLEQQKEREVYSESVPP